MDPRSQYATADIGLRGILKAINLTVGWFNLHETEPEKFIREKQVELVVLHALKQIDLKQLMVTVVKMHSHLWRLLIWRSGLVEEQLEGTVYPSA